MKSIQDQLQTGPSYRAPSIKVIVIELRNTVLQDSGYYIDEESNIVPGEPGESDGD